MSDTPKDAASPGDTQNNPPCHCPECGKTTTFEHELSDRCAVCGHFVGRGTPPRKAVGNTTGFPVLSAHPFVASRGVTVGYRANCPDCKKQTEWTSDLTGSWCIDCRYFVRREIITDAPIITPKDAVKTPQPSVVSEVVEKCIVCGGDEPCSHDFDAMAAQEAQGFTKAAPPPEKPYIGPPEDYLNDAALTKLIMAATKARLHTAEEISHLLEWAHRVHLESCLLDLVLNGKLLFQWNTGGPQFFAPEKAPEEPAKYSDRSPRPKMPLEWLQSGRAKCPICEEATTWSKDETGAWNTTCPN